MMGDTAQALRTWAYEEFGHAALGDTRRTVRLVRMAAAVAGRPAGKVTEVFRTSAERQGAYDFLSNDNVRSEDLLDAIERATVQRCLDHAIVHVVIDGTSLRLTDRARSKDFGAVGSHANGARGLKVVHAYAIAPTGVPLGILDQQWWARTPSKKRNDCQNRPLEAKETVHWVRAIEAATAAFTRTDVHVWFQIDREGDRYWTLKVLSETGQWFTVRSTYAHRFVVSSTGRRRRLRDVVRKSKVRYERMLAVPERPKRKARMARLQVRTALVTLDMVEAFTGERLELPVTVVDVREIGTTPRGEEPLHWRLLTNHPVITDDDAEQVILGYSYRWAIEDLHRAWKSGVCRVEDAQLRSTARMVKWAIIMITVAARVERLKALSRSNPHQPAGSELNSYEIDALLLLKRRHARPGQRISARPPTLGQAVRWIAELGGYTGKSSGGPPGSVTIRRGLEYLAPIALALECLQSEGKMR
jgi:hypothetical protein